MFFKQIKELLKGCGAMDWPNKHYFCKNCPKRCSYAVHVHKHKKRVRVLDETAMSELRNQLDVELKSCLRFDFKNMISQVSLYQKIE